MTEHSAHSELKVQCVRSLFVELSKNEPEEVFDGLGIKIKPGDDIKAFCKNCSLAGLIHIGRAYTQILPDAQNDELSPRPDCA